MGHPWQHRPAWRVLDTHFSSGQRFLSTWLAWRRDEAGPRTLHYVAISERPCRAQDLLTLSAANSADSSLAPLAQALGAQWFGLLPGFHRFVLDHGRVNLTLCVGGTLDMLRAQHFEADAVELSDPRTSASDLPWFFKALACCCRRGTTLAVHDRGTANGAELSAALTQCGFVIRFAELRQGQTTPEQMVGQFDPSWTLRHTRRGLPHAALPIQRCAVIGAGVAGASIAASLARRGWQVRVLDQAPAPAAGASGMPAGLVVPHVSSDDCALSRLSRAGVRLMLQQAHELLDIHQDWGPTGVLERQMNGTPKLPNRWTQAGQQWSENYDDANAADPLEPAIWHHQGAWMKPATLVNTWLKLPGVTFQGNSKVADMRRQDATWEVLDETGKRLCCAERVVFANACGAFDLLQKMEHHSQYLYGIGQHFPSKKGMRGLLSWGHHQGHTEARFPPFPVNGSGSVMPRIPVEGGRAWFIGSTYQPDSQVERDDQANHNSNLAQLAQLLPSLAEQLAPVFATGTLNHWKGTRCVTSDRLPAVGPLQVCEQPSLWLCAGMGSRGLSFSVLCAELLAAQFGAEPLPVEAKLARMLKALRN